MWKRIILYIVLAYVGMMLFAYFFSDKMMFFPPRSGYQDNQDVIKLKTKNGETISAFYFPNKQAKYLILFSHGNATDIGYMKFYFEALQKAGFAVFAYDYEGYGTSTGSPSESHAYNDVNAAYDYVTKILKFSPAHIIAYGESLGTGVAVDLAVRKPVAGLILEKPFVSAFRVVTHIPILPFDKFNNFKKIKKIHCPVLVVHGTKDKVIPFYHGRRIYKAANPPKQFYWVKGAGHNNLYFIAGEKLLKTIKRFEQVVDSVHHTA